MKKLILSFLLAAVFAVTAAAAPLSYSYDAYGDVIPAPEAYTVSAIHTGALYDGKPLSVPEDMFAAKDGKLYICDTGNNRIVVLNPDFSFVRSADAVTEIGEPSPLKAPQGIFVSSDNELYICDSGNGRVVITDSDFNIKKASLLRPESSLIPESAEFKPQKIVVDSANNVYVIAYGLYQGLITYDQNGDFTGFFGSNPVELSLGRLALLFWKNLFTRTQNDASIQFVPVEFSNVYIDTDDAVYTSTRKTESSQDEIKKLNALGHNVLRYPLEGTLYPPNDFGDLEVTIEQINVIDSRFEDVHVDADGVISALDTQRGRIFQYDQDCNLMFIFGGNDNQKGLFAEPVAIEKAGDTYMVLDKFYGSVTVFTPTAYAQTVREATVLYNEGYYVESKALWEDVLRQSNYYSLAYRGIGKALLQQREYAEAMKYLKKGADRIGYSEAFGELRKENIRKYAGLYLAGMVLVLWLIFGALPRLLRRWGVLEPKPKKKKH